MRVSLFCTCLVDQLWPTIGTSTVALLESVGCEVSFDERQTCCGQPAWNSGHRREAARVARAFLDVYADSDADAIVSPSGSCSAMVHHLPSLFDRDDPDRRRAESVASRFHDLTSFLVHEIGVEKIAASFHGRIAWHDACHGLRDLGIKTEPRHLLARVAGAEVLEMGTCEDCCGFGGTFSVKMPELSVAMLDRKIDEIERLGLDAVVSGDASCLMQIGGRLERRGVATRVLHLSELLVSTT